MLATLVHEFVYQYNLTLSNCFHFQCNSKQCKLAAIPSASAVLETGGDDGEGSSFSCTAWVKCTTSSKCTTRNERQARIDIVVSCNPRICWFTAIITFLLGSYIWHYYFPLTQNQFSTGCVGFSLSGSGFAKRDRNPHFEIYMLQKCEIENGPCMLCPPWLMIGWGCSPSLTHCPVKTRYLDKRWMIARSGVVLCLLAVLDRCMHMACGQYALVYGAMSTVIMGWVSPLVHTLPASTGWGYLPRVCTGWFANDWTLVNHFVSTMCHCVCTYVCVSHIGLYLKWNVDMLTWWTYYQTSSVGWH